MAKGGDSKGLSSAVKAAGANVSKKEATKIAEQTGKTVAQVMAKALDKGATLGSSLVNNYNKGNLGPNSQNVTNFGGVPIGMGANGATTKAIASLQALQGLKMGQGQVYAGSTTTTTPAQNHWDPLGGSSRTPGTTTYNPIVLPRAVAKAASTPAATPTTGTAAATDTNTTKPDANDLPAPNNGEFDNIIENLKWQLDAGKAEAESWRTKAAEDLAATQSRFQEQLNSANAAYQQQLLDAQTANDGQMQYLQDLMIQQQQGFAQQTALQQQQTALADAQYKEQLRQANALSRAYVPGMQATADSPISGDYRNAGITTKNNSTLSSLSILSDTSSIAPSLVGLQIA